MQFTDDEIETIKDIINEHGSDCPGTDSNKVQELIYKLGLEKRPTAEEIAEQERRIKEIAESPFGKQMAALFSQSNSYAEKIAADIMRDNVFMSGEQWPTKFNSILRIQLPKDYIVNNVKPTLFQRVRKYLNV